jgi:Derlin-2/3
MRMTYYRRHNWRLSCGGSMWWLQLSALCRLLVVCCGVVFVVSTRPIATHHAAVMTTVEEASTNNCRSSNYCVPTGPSPLAAAWSTTSQQQLRQQQPSRWGCSSIPRGGAYATSPDENDDDDEVDDMDDDDDDMDDDDDEMMLDFDTTNTEMQESDFSEDTTLDRFWSAWTKTPPVTKGYLSASILVTLYGYLFTKNEFPSVLLLNWNKILTRLQIWRMFTSFLNFGPFGLGYIMTAQFVWVYMSTLERLNHNKPYDFWIMILFGQLCMVIGYPVMKLSPKFLGHNLSTFLVYIWSRYHEGVEVNMFELFNTRAEMLPWFFLAQTFLLEGELPILDFLGIVFGHIYHHCKTVGILRAPDGWKEWYETSDAAQPIRELYKPISSDFDAP